LSRSLPEIRFRLIQEIANAFSLLRPPRPDSRIGTAKQAALLPDPASFLPMFRDSDFARETIHLAERTAAHRFPIFGETVDTGPEIRWRRDYRRNIESGTAYFRRVPYLDVTRAGDHKLIWELNRHQHLIVLAQAFLLTGRRDFLDEIPRQLISWWAQNPWLCGMNWVSALEVAFRALSWIWVDHLVGAALDAEFRSRLCQELYRHGIYLNRNLSVYFAPNTHLLGEAVALHALGVLYPDWPHASAWARTGAQIAAEQMERQVRSDGTHFEQSTCYHVYALDLFLFHSLLNPHVSASYRQKLLLMAEYLAAISSRDGAIPFLGDDDGGNVFRPYGDRRRFAAATLAACKWRGMDVRHSEAPRFFPDAGVAVLSSEPLIVADAHGFGAAGAGHSHAHALSVVCRADGRDILIDPGTYTYVGEPEWRSRFRGTAFHNTIRVDGLDQAVEAGPFRWLQKPEAAVSGWISNSRISWLRASCTYRGLVHERQIVWIAEIGVLAVLDTVRESGEPSGPHLVEQFWHCGEPAEAVAHGAWRIAERAILVLPANSSFVESQGWQSEMPGRKAPRPVVTVAQQTVLPAMMAAVLIFGQDATPAIELHPADGGARLQVGADLSIGFGAGEPLVRRS
jgi:hypothetical protein